MQKITFNKKELIEIVERSSTINERLSSGFIPNELQENDATINSRIEQWCKVAAQGNWEKFEQRLAWDGLDLSTVRPILGSVHMSEEQQLPAWAEILNECLKSTASVSPKILEKGILERSRFLDIQDPLPFEEVLLPFICVASEKLRTQASSCYELLSEEAHTSLERCLLGWLSYLCLPSLELEFSIFRTSRQSTVASLSRKPTGGQSRQQYQDFIQGLLTGGLLTFFWEYPVLARLAATTIDLWVDATREFLSRLASDWSEIQETFQAETEIRRVVAIQPYLSDRHNNGRCVTTVTFASGLKLVYKPKNLGLEQAYVKLVEWLNEHGAPLPFKLFKVIERSTYGWVEFVEALPCKDKEEVRKYYKRAGMLLCLVHILGATDLHLENIIACSEYPVLIDLETLMHPWVQDVQNSETAKGAISLAMANKQLLHSVLRTGFLPKWESDIESQPYDLSGLGKFSQQETVYRIQQWLNINTDAMVGGYENIGCQPQTNISTLDAPNLSLNNYHEEIVAGFQQMYWFLMEQRQAILAIDSPLKLLNHQLLRFVFRPTKAYSIILRATLEPNFLRNGVERSIQLDILSRDLLPSKTKSLFWPLLKIEQRALEQMDIPIFTARSDSCNLVVAPAQTIDKCFTEPSFNLVVSRLNQLNDRDLEQQMGFIWGALYAYAAGEIHRFIPSENADIAFDTAVSLTQSEIVRQSIMIARNLQKQAIGSDDGSATWIAPQYVPQVKRFQLQPMGYSLYEGSCGVSLFLAALENVTGGAGFRDLALAALQSLRYDLREGTFTQILRTMGIGGATGCSSIIYVLVRVSQFLKEPALLEYAKQVASLITPDLIAADQNFDIVSGAAGAILALLALYNSSADLKALEQAIACGNHLLNYRLTSDSGYKTWATIEGKLLTGFAHGATGIAYALLRLHQITGDNSFFKAADEALTYEYTELIPKAVNCHNYGKSLTKERPGYGGSWCYGAPGFGLARVAVLDILDTDDIRQSIESAIKTTKQHKLSSIDHICCGNFGRIEFMVTTARKLSQPQLLETAVKQAAQVVARAEQRGSFSYNPSLGYTPGFFQGASGIGYELLRLAYPDQLPSVLLWE